MSEHILTSEEVDAILKATKEKGQDLSKIVGSVDPTKAAEKQYEYALININDLVRAETERNFNAFLRKKVHIQTKSFSVDQADKSVPENAESNYVYTVFRINPKEYYGVVALDYSFLHQTLTLLYGGRVNPDTPVSMPGKVGLIVAEKIAQIFLAAIVQACKEYGEINCEIIRTTSSLNLSSNIGLRPDDSVYALEFSVFFDEIETTIKLLLSEDFLIDFIPARIEGNRHREKDFWRAAIKTQVVDSMVTIGINLPDVSMKVKDFMALGEGDVIPIHDPTLVYVCLNNLKLFRAAAGQANNKLVAKILSQI